MSKNIAFKTNHVLIVYNKYLNKLKKKYYHQTIINIEFQKDCFEKIVDLINPYITSKKDDCIKMIKILLGVIPGYSRSHKTRQGIICNNLYYTAVVKNSGQTVFWHLPSKLISDWHNLTLKERFNYKQSQVLLACFWCHCFYSTLKTRDPFFRIGDIIKLTNFSEETVRKYLSDLSKRGIISFSISEARKEYTLKYLPKSSEPFEYNNDPFIGDFFASINLNDVDFVRYIYSKDLKISNPFLYISNDGIITVNRQILNMEYVITSILSENKLKDLLMMSHTARRINYTVESIRNRLREYVDRIKNTKPPIDLPPHYIQIYQILPLLDYVGRRHFEVDFDKLQHFIYLYQYRMKVAKNRFFMIYQEFIKTEPDLFGWDKEYLFFCLGKNDSEKEWQKKYKIKDIRLMPLNLGFPMEKIQISSKEIQLRDKEDLLKQLKWYPVEQNFIGIDALTKDAISKICDTAWGGQELFDYFVSKNALNNLLQIENNVNRNKGISIISTPSVFGNPTHRIYMENVSSQNIAKINRPVIRAKTGHQFLMIDICQMELELIKWYVRKEYSNAEIINLTFENIADDIHVKRDIVKSMFYPWSYGASKQTIIDETNATEEEFEKFLNYVTTNTPIYDFMKKVEKEVRGNYVTRETPLGFRIPLFLGSYKGLAYLIQSAGAELFIRWLLKVHEANLSVFIINVIHDEIIFEIPENYNLYDFTKKVRECLDDASRGLFGDLKFDTKQRACRYWDETTAGCYLS